MIRQRTFCCCIPVRAGVITLAIIGLIGGTGVAAIGCLNLVNLPPTQGNRIANGIQVGLYIVLALVSLFGLIGAIMRKRSLINLYFAILVGHLLFSFALGVYGMYRVFKDSPEYMEKCQNDSSDDKVFMKICREGDLLVKGIVVGVSIIAWLLEIWACVIVFNYSKQLEEEENVESVVKDNEVW
ncbi:hypothetical protein NP233_g3112 [Leucocoprinus birnbaumii]|uniref:Uncharacterized protein n=1 Tax=Leucocoprinus birnbaumii TaxID=56174 RepID=A0AAD5VX42_9AGAR|nr:hypothetical protein NP233_g3112 [Leucocoprinus birnbaumii]